MIMAVEGVVKWLRECFREDRSRKGVGDFLGGKVLHKHLLSGREALASGFLPEVVVSPTYAQEASAHAALYRREQEVVYACLFLCGQHDGKPCRAPLLFYQGAFGEESQASFSIDTTRWRINPRVLEILECDTDGLTAAVEGGVLSEGVIGSIRDWAQSQGVNADALWSWPELVSRETLNDAAKGSQLTLLPAAAVGIMPRSVSSRGVIDELDSLSKLGHDGWSEPLRVMMGVTPMQTYQDSDGFMAVPALLSRSQEKILTSARVNPVTLCHGPPGTGKSFTIAAIALNHVARGESVLVASHMDHAVDVVWEKIDAMLGGEEVTVRAGRQGYLSQLKKFIEACLAGQMTANLTDEAELKALLEEVKETMRTLHSEERELEDEWRKALSRGSLLAKPNPSILDRIRKHWVTGVVYGRHLLMELSAHLNDLYIKRERQLGRYLRRQRKHLLSDALQKDSTRADFKMMLSALKKYRGSEQEEVFRKMDVGSVLAALPVWLVNLKDVHRVLPMQKELFDVAIIDESSQCDLASVLPIMQRAKRLVVAGDTYQLRHMSFLSRARQEVLARELGVTVDEQEQYNYRDMSLMDHAASMVSSQSQVGFLNEHFRSSPRIIAFSNKKFYQNALQVMKERPWGDQKEALQGRWCDGVRDELGVNRAEVEAVVVELVQRVEPALHLHPSQRSSIGVLCPFRNQVEAIREAIQERFGSMRMDQLINDHDLRIGTAHTFQGEERDVMLISLCVDSDVGASTLRFVEREDVFNVSITRARSQQIIFHSLRASELPSNSMLGEYLTSFDRGVEAVDVVAAPDSFSQEVLEALREEGIDVRPMRRVAGVGIDLVLIDGDRVMGLDLLGYPGETFAAVDRHRSKILRRAGFRLFPLGYTEWVTQKEHVISVICHELRHDTRYR